jgi:hypothetical protein
MVKALLTGGTVYKPISEKREAYFVKSCSYGKQGAEVSKEEHVRSYFLGEKITLTLS